jgi:hypothetical protein
LSIDVNGAPPGIDGHDVGMTQCRGRPGLLLREASARQAVPHQVYGVEPVWSAA